MGFTPNRVLEWSGSDSEEAYVQNCSKQPDDWYYRNKKIEYAFNSNGHRCKEIADIDISNYILFTGCSFTEGVGLELEKTYPYVVSKELGCDYYNMGLGGTGIDAASHNVITWISKTKNQPKAIIIQWPQPSRVMIPGTAPMSIRFRSVGAWQTDPHIQTFMASGEEIGFFNARNILLQNLIKNVSRCPVYIDNTLGGYNSVNDYARDCGHPGIRSNQIYAERVHSLISSHFR